MDQGLWVAYETLYNEQEGEFSRLHRELRVALSQVEWLRDEFGHEDPRRRDNADRQRRVAGRGATAGPREGAALD